MKSKAVGSFWDSYNQLPQEIQEQALKQYGLWLENPQHPSLRFKKVGADFWSVRITDDYRAVGIRDGETVLWFFIGSHADYNRVLKKG